MAQGGMFKILSKKNKKRMISDDKNSETIKVTKVLQFFSNTQPKDAKLGETIRFMHNPGNGLTVYWLQVYNRKIMQRELIVDFLNGLSQVVA